MENIKKAVSSRGYIALSEIEERNLIMKCKEGNELSIEELVERNIGLIMKVANTYGKTSYKGLTFDDLFQHATIHFMNSIKTFDFEKNTKFSTHAMTTMNLKLRTFINSNNEFGMKVTVRNIEELRKLKKVKEELRYEMGVDPDVYTLSEELNMSVEKINLLMSEDYKIKNDEVLDGEGNSSSYINDFVLDSNVNVEEEVINKTIIEDIYSKLNDKLNERDFQILMSKVENPNLNNQSIGEEYGISNQSVKNIFVKIGKVMFDVLNEEYGITYESKREAFKKSLNKKELVVFNFISKSKKIINERLVIAGFIFVEEEIEELIVSVREKIKGFELSIENETNFSFNAIFNSVY